MPVDFTVKSLLTGEIVRTGTAPTTAMANANLWNPTEEEIILTGSDVDTDSSYVTSGGTTVTKDASPVTITQDVPWLADGVDELIFNNIPIPATIYEPNTGTIVEAITFDDGGVIMHKASSTYNNYNESGNPGKFGTAYSRPGTGAVFYNQYPYTAITTEDFTIDLQVKTSLSANIGFFGIGPGDTSGPASGALSIGYNSGWIIRCNNVETVGSTGLNSNTWHHLVLQRNGSILRLFVDGVEKVNVNIGSFSLASMNGVTHFGGGYCNGAKRHIFGYIDDWRWIVGEAVYPTTGFSPPETSVINKVLFLLHGEDITDSSVYKQSLTNSTSVTASTNQFKFGTKSLLFNGSSQFIYRIAADSASIGDGDWGIDMWIYPLTVSQGRTIVDFRNSSSDTSKGIALHYDGSSKLVMRWNAATRITSDTTISINTWTHIAVERYSGTFYMYINGTKQTQSYTDSQYGTTTYFYLGYRTTNISGFTDNYYHGHIDEVRVMRGDAPYKNANFTPETSAYPSTGGNGAIPASQLYIEMLDKSCVTAVGPIEITDNPLRLTTDTPGTYKIRITSWENDPTYGVIPYADYEVTKDAV